MKITYDKEADALSISFNETTVTTEHVAEGIALDYDKNHVLAGIEILDASIKLGDLSTLKKILLENIGLVEA
ncbi:MAG: DUF2283 domain-containing protein [Chitinophagales bacterium]